MFEPPTTKHDKQYYFMVRQGLQPHLVFSPGDGRLLVDPVRQSADPGESVLADPQHGAQRLPRDLPGAGQHRVH